jgi:hypothetical protein
MSIVLLDKDAKVSPEIEKWLVEHEYFWNIRTFAREWIAMESGKINHWKCTTAEKAEIEHQVVDITCVQTKEVNKPNGGIKKVQIRVFIREFEMLNSEFDRVTALRKEHRKRANNTDCTDNTKRTRVGCCSVTT